MTAAALVVAALALVYLLTRLRVNQPYERALVFRLGRLTGVRGGGLYLLLPIVDRAVKVDMRTRVETFSGQELVTKDGLTLKIDFVLWLRVVDAERAVIEVENWWEAVSRAAETAMRDVVGQKLLSELLADRAVVNERIKALLDVSTAGWGVLADRVEIKDIDIPETMRRAMAREAEAVREKAARLIKAEGELEAARKLNEAAELLSPSALKVRELQTISEVGVEKNSVIIMVPMEAISGGGAAASLALAAGRDRLRTAMPSSGAAALQPEQPRTRRGLMLAVVAPSGAGKTSLSRRLVADHPELELSISCTTRGPRPGEKEGREYYFIAREAFDSMVAEDAFLEWADVHTNRYGTPKAPVMAVLEQGRDVLFDIDWQGAGAIARRAPGDLVRVFILPPSMPDLKRRLYARAQDDDGVIRRRLESAPGEIAHWEEYDYVIVNDDFDHAYTDLMHIYRAERLRRQRSPGSAASSRGC